MEPLRPLCRAWPGLLVVVVACHPDATFEQSAAALIDGTAAPSEVVLSPLEQHAVGRLWWRHETLCTGWAVSPRHVVTAAHCFSAQVGPGDVDFAPGGGSTRVPLLSVEKHPTLDVALVTLGRRLEADVVSPLAMNDEPPSERWVGEVVEVAGAGFGTPVTRSVSFSPLFVAAVGVDTLQVDRVAWPGLCRGDSGGPYLKTFAERPFTRVVALESAGAASCEGPNWGPRVDLFAGWARARLLGPAPELTRCEASTAARCEGDLLGSCVDGLWRVRDCAAAQQRCGFVSVEAGAGCLPRACGALDGRGVCGASGARWCGPGGPEEVDCGARGLGCGFDDAAQGFRCRACEVCAGQCVELTSDGSNCGACGRRCSSGQCVQGSCVVVGEEDDVDVSSPARSPGCSSSGLGGWLAVLVWLWRKNGRRPATEASWSF
jgi:hypothetical protein